MGICICMLALGLHSHYDDNYPLAAAGTSAFYGQLFQGFPKVTLLHTFSKSIVLGLLN